MEKSIFIAISFLIGLFCIRFIRSYDKHEKEPFLTMFIVTFWGGVWSIFIASLLYVVVHKLGIAYIENTFGALFIIGPIEEFAKLLALFSAYFIIRKELNEPVDGMIYMSCVALGFSLIENFFYAIKPNSGHLLFLRLFIATPMHICFSAFMGLSFYIWLKNKRTTSLLFLSFVLASVSHGVYDLVIFNGLALLVLIIVVRVIFSWTMDLLSYATAQSPHRISLREFVDLFSYPTEQDGIECLNCGSTNQKITYSMDKIIVQKCDSCEYYVTTKKSLFYIFKHFAATFKNISKHYLSVETGKKRYFTLYKNNHISDTKNIAFFNLDNLNETLEKLNKSIIEKMEEKWWFPKNLLELEKPD